MPISSNTCQGVNSSARLSGAKSFAVPTSRQNRSEPTSESIPIGVDEVVRCLPAPVAPKVRGIGAASESPWVDQALNLSTSRENISVGANDTLFQAEDDDYYEDEWESEYKSGDDFDFATVSENYEEHYFHGMPSARDFPTALRRRWETKFKTRTAEFFRELFDTKKVGLGGGVVIEDDDTVRVRCEMVRPGTRSPVGILDRVYHFAEDIPFVHHQRFELGLGAQGRGIAKDLLANSVKLYQRMGIRLVTTQADGSVGGYAWAKFGFTPAPGRETRKLYTEIRERLARLPISTALKQVVRKLLRATTPKRSGLSLT